MLTVLVGRLLLEHGVDVPAPALAFLVQEMLAAAEDLRFEYAARLRDEIRELRRELTEIQRNEAPAA